MGEISEFVVSLWCVPVILFIFLPLFVGCLWVLYHMFGESKPVTGQENKPAKFNLRKGKAA